MATSLGTRARSPARGRQSGPRGGCRLPKLPYRDQLAGSVEQVASSRRARRTVLRIEKGMRRPNMRAMEEMSADDSQSGNAVNHAASKADRTRLSEVAGLHGDLGDSKAERDSLGH